MDFGLQTLNFRRILVVEEVIASTPLVLYPVPESCPVNERV